jgi:SAM-dependent methyltransferase
LIAKVLHRLSFLFGAGPLTLAEFRQLIDRYKFLPLQRQILVWARLICLQPIIKTLEQWMPSAPGRVADLGSGFGLVSLLVASRHNRPVWGVEASPSRAAISQQAAVNLKNVAFQSGDIVTTEIQPSGVILLIDVLSFFPDEIQQEILTRCGRALTHGGILIIKDNGTIPGWKYRYTNFEEAVKRLMGVYGIKIRKKLNHHSPEGWRRLIQQANLQICEETLISAVAPYPGVIYVCRRG